MAIYDGIFNSSDPDAIFNTIKTFLTTQLELTCTVDSGLAGTRLMSFTNAGYYHAVQFYWDTGPAINIRLMKIDGVTSLRQAHSHNITLGNTFTGVKYNDGVYFSIERSGTHWAQFWFFKSNTLSYSSIRYNSTPIATISCGNSDSYCTTTPLYFITSTRPTSGKYICSEVFYFNEGANGSNSVDFSSDALKDVLMVNSSPFGAGTRVQIGTYKYLVTTGLTSSNYSVYVRYE